MYLIIPIKQFKLQYLLFTKPKKNILLDGIFTKLIYSDDKMAMNGLFLNFPIDGNLSENSKIQQFSDNYYSKNLLCFDIENNIEVINMICDIEKQLLNYYLEYNSLKKNPVYILKKQLVNGKIKYYKEQYFQKSKPDDTTTIPYIKNDKKHGFYIKISGIWETNDEIGIIYKINEYVY